ncbi:hypothetical protein NLI96_g3177 [Meripilus lineatus]|uniref:Uncharacterized protein n=1 Tax=Meripilus lineatus TaxID=2056292 RepID=A0AAD5V790_9APHY|nr:hypothetical protein NLI96_g3177 [Physisporinus lineatus]
MIRIDFAANTSGWSTPRQGTAGAHAIVDDTGDDDVFTSRVNAHAKVKWLETKVARVAAKKCSVEEVSALHRELQVWLKDTPTIVKPSSIQLSAALLHAILTNYNAHSEATKSAKHAEMELKDQLEEVEVAKEKLESELRR